ncbi:MAG: primosomal protein N', partial [Betaproteobacteria bacterium]
KIEVYDAVPSAVYKVAGMFRGQILLQSKNRKVLQRFLSAWLPMLENMRDGKVRFSLDIDPVEL